MGLLFSIRLVQSCSHVDSFLFAINNYNMEIESKEKEEACTSKKINWNVPRKMVMDPKPLKECSKVNVFLFPTVFKVMGL